MRVNKGVQRAEVVPPADGALAPLFAAAHPRVAEHREAYAGAFLVPYGEIFEKTGNMQDAVLAKDLWKISDEVVREFRN